MMSTAIPESNTFLRALEKYRSFKSTDFLNEGPMANRSYSGFFMEQEFSECPQYWCAGEFKPLGKFIMRSSASTVDTTMYASTEHSINCASSTDTLGDATPGAPKRMDQFVEEHQLDKSQWTTLMIRNIPCRYTQEWLLDEIRTSGLRCNFLYLPPAIRKHFNLGYAFVNFVTPDEARRFIDYFQGHAFSKQPNSLKRAEVDYAKLQGFQENVTFHSSTRTAKGENRPWVGDNNGEAVQQRA
jgi:hypothetical protein